MLGDKSVQVTETYAPDGIPQTGEKAGTVEDREAMRRLGKQQLFKRNFGFLSIFGFALILMATWQSLLGTIALALGNGGPSGLLYTYIVAYIGFTLTIASMAEMASMAPTSGGQYHWVSEFAPRHLQKLFSYFIGWLSVLGYQGVILVLHFAGWLAIVVPLWVLGPRTPHAGVWNTFVDAGWGNTGLACMVGFITSAGAFAGGDAAAHMAEELKNAPKILPRAMLCTVVGNGIMGFITLVTFLYTMGDVDAALASPTKFPIIEVFRNATNSNGGATDLTSILVVLGIAGSLTNVAGASRQMFAFARDKGLPAHRWVSRVPPRFDVPVNAVLVSSVIACILHCINIGSAIAFNIILSIGSVALLTSYMVSVGCVTWRRLKGLPLLETRFSLGKAGLPVNLAALAFLAVVYVFSFFPPIPNPPPEAMNWAIVVYGGVLIFAGIYYLIVARHHYDGPVEYTRKSA
ncbi:hypothetical protein PMZ80_004167 [Knufia obscura]|uniref:Amino acid permease n=2 Tax=Knufia TaxID=430999 RepID=A0AAN8I1D0_9EURO|nr:hypothetical protein PMZ80_004167 [Knufia obscura]KAK5948707.1 hypothetical protein OHC33_010310 [Knufia fluminis]